MMLDPCGTSVSTPLTLTVMFLLDLAEPLKLLLQLVEADGTAANTNRRCGRRACANVRLAASMMQSHY
jgi:hypothetical protein